MKNIIKFGITSLLIILLFGCENNDGKISNDEIDSRGIDSENPIIGNWKLVEASISSGGPQYLVAVENGEEFNFLSTGIFISNRSSECTSGIFSIESNELILKYDCDGFITGVENPEGAITYTITYESNYLILIPTSVICTEGCSYKYEKITDTK